MTISRDQELTESVRRKDVTRILEMMLDGGKIPIPRSGYRTEGELWDYKAGCPAPNSTKAFAWAEISRHVLAFHNGNGGVIFFGISDDYSFCGTRTFLDSKLVNDQLRRYLGDQLWVEYHRQFIQPDQSYLGVLLIPPRGPRILRFKCDSPRQNDGSYLFRSGESAIRDGDSTRTLNSKEADELTRRIHAARWNDCYAVDEPYFRILAPEYSIFIERPELCEQIERALKDPRTSITSLLGIGGMGKTALATWTTLRSYDRKDFEFIVSTTAKDRELTAVGIQALNPDLSTFESLLDCILEILGFSELIAAPVAKREKEVRTLLRNSNGLLYIDNLETIDDARVIEFLENLPEGVRALVTSRRTTVRRAVYPIDIEQMTNDEILAFIDSFRDEPGFGYVNDLTQDEKISLGHACDGIALAIRWVLARSKNAEEATSYARSFTDSNKQGDELLEFCFRRVFEQMSRPERAVLQVLSLFQAPIPSEAILVGAALPAFKLLDAKEELSADGIVRSHFDEDRNDYCFSLLPVVQRFVYDEVKTQPNLESRIRKKMADWFEARDIRHEEERPAVRAARQGAKNAEAGLLDLAIAASRRGDPAAEDLFKQALQRNPRSWRAARQYAEYQRHEHQNITEALRLYEQAAANAPSQGRDRALIFREWGMLLRECGDPVATDTAIGKFRIALKAEPQDALATHALAAMLFRKAHFGEVVDLLKPLSKSGNRKTRMLALDLLLKAHERNGDIVEAAYTRDELEKLR
ncbi:RNA-binding domain-containing protein [Myxococcota bacterium]